ncbi:TetR family transcriptional regulator [Acetobacteraceae bacterium H6797]|nr:TetR family transcriptional regulator [Acetobacteraceae bacterium H6797]
MDEPERTSLMPDTTEAVVVSSRRSRAPEQTRRAIIDAAIAEFSEKGFSGGRVDDIAARTATTKRMIYYYFGSKEQLYTAVLEEKYGEMRAAEQALHLDELPVREAMIRLVEVTFDHHHNHPEFVRLVAVENIHEARHVSASPTIRGRNEAVIGTLRGLLARGQAEGVFRTGVEPFDLHMLISSFCFHRVANRHTLGAIFGQDLRNPAITARQRAMVVESVLRYLQP